MSQDPMADAYLAASETMDLRDRNLEAKVRGWVRDEIIKILTKAEKDQQKHKRRSP